MGSLTDLIRRSLRLPVCLPLLVLSLTVTRFGPGPSQAHFTALFWAAGRKLMKSPA